MNHHYAELGDVWKHLILAEILKIKPPLQYWQTHAGSAYYTLIENGPRKHGVINFLLNAPADPELNDCAYLKIFQDMPGKYPGSSVLAVKILGKKAGYLLCDMDSESTYSLNEVFADFDAEIIEKDGISAIQNRSDSSELNPSEILIHIDPFNPYERVAEGTMNSFELAVSLIKKGFRILYWYGYKKESDTGHPLKEMTKLAPDVNFWSGEVLLPSPFIYPERSGFWGCGIVLANVSEKEKETCSALGNALERIYANDILKGNVPDRLKFKEFLF
ncbi:MAG: 23S rRNA (adenine(2030)-N(6))-methyltransferase RlmJ [Spirochaetes bacterium]|nr:23S rRNA (adenine(2030)-N(6))-methyltransferase RlmJ [Spirochaetota bacterium]